VAGTVAQFVTQLRLLGIRVSADGDQLQCSAPKGVLTEALRRELTARKAEVLAWLRSDDSAAPLSFAQQRLWFLDQLEPGTWAYTVAIRQRFRGPLDVATLTRALTEIVRRHDVLRTTFLTRHGQPVQHVAAPGPVALPTLDFDPEDPAARERVVGQVVLGETRRPFDLARGPLIRPLLIRLDPERHDLVVSLHHMIADGWSLGILARELSVLYEAFATGHASPLPELPIQYADFAAWQREWLTGSALENERRYWLDHLADRPAPLRLPSDHPRSSAPTRMGASHDVVLPRELADGLRELSRRQGATLFMTLLAGFEALLSRYTGQEDVVVGTPIANRNHVELEPLIGLFANTLVLRTDLSSDPTFRELLARVRETCLGAYAHPDMPFEKLVEDLQPARALGQNPLFEISFVFQDAGEGTDVSFLPVASPFELTLFVRDRLDGRLGATLQYARDLFEPETIARLMGHYRSLLQGVLADPEGRLSALPLLDDAEAHRLLVDWNATAAPYPRQQSIPACFEAQVDATPHAVALVFEGGTLTYDELDRRANRLAHHLRALGVGAEGVVGVWMDRSPELIVALLAIVKAGGAYAPFDLLAPPSRLATMVSVAKIDLILTREAMRHRPDALGVRTICVDAEADAIARRPDDRFGAPTSAESLAYVMFTSGSTGEPKGVGVMHRNVVRLVKGTDYASFGPDEVFLHLSSPSFDASTFEIWGALLNGGRLAIAPPGVPSVAEVGSLLRRYGVTTLWLTAGLFHEMVDHGLDDLRPLRRLLAGGDVLSPAHVARVLNALPGLRLVNGYGPTEGTTFTCCHAVTTAPPPGRSVPIGRPIANTRVYVLDRRRRPVPIGVPGELWIAGDGLARGYVDRPQLTIERFVEARLAPALEERLYRTGDLVRWLPDGTLEFHGRLDDQTKVRGHRVELGDIEAALVQHPRIRAASVARKLADGEPRLVAYVVGDDPTDPRELREFLARALPEYMIPAAFMTLERLPLGANGKVDRTALPEPASWAASTEPVVEPRDELERRLVRIWQDVLAVGAIGVRDSFFDLGGHSLLAVRLFARLESELAIDLPLATLFEAPTVEGLAAFIRDTARPSVGLSMVAIQRSGHRLPIFGLPGVGGGVLGYHALARLLGSDQPFYGLESRGLDGLGRPLTRIEDIAAVCVREIREVQREGPYHLVGMCMGGVVAWEIAQQLRRAGQPIGLLALIETWPSETVAAPRRPWASRVPAVLGFVGNRLRLYRESLAGLRGRARWRYLLGRLKPFTDLVRHRDPFRGVRAEIHRHAVARANLFAFQRYEPRPYPGPVVLIYAEGRRLTEEPDGRLRWRQLAAELEVYGVAGNDSGQLLKEPHVRVVAAQLAAHLRRSPVPAAARRA
jgi:amino acid adenylation domain-containing protein